MRVLLLLLLAANGWAWQLKTLEGLRLAPDGRRVLFTESWPDLTANRKHSRLMSLRLAGGGAAVVEHVPEGAGEVTWSPDGGRIAYLANGFVWTARPGGVPVKVCSYARPNGYLARSGAVLAWSPDGTRLAFAGTAEAAPGVQDPRVVTRILYKTRTGFSDNRRMHVFVVDAGGGVPRQLTTGAFDEHSIDWGGDGREIVFLSNREKDPDAVFNYDLFAAEVATGRVRRLTETPGVEMNPRVSPDGRFVAYLATKRPVTTIDSVAEHTHVWVIPIEGGVGREVSAELDQRCASVKWSADGRQVYFVMADHGRLSLFQVGREGGRPEAVDARRGEISDYAVSRGGLVTVFQDAEHAQEIYVDGRRRTHFNTAKAVSVPEDVRFESFDGTVVEGFLYPAVGVAGKAPLVLSIHGGPHGMVARGFNATFQEMAAAGYAVLALNPRGSAGYGQKFSDGTLNDWGGGDYRDLMLGVDHVLARHAEIDGTRMAVMGASYGGYMTNWVITQTRRFRAAVSVASLSNLVSFYGTSLYQDLLHAEYGGLPWTGGRFEALWNASPLKWVGAAETPTLFLHGEADHDVPITQGEEMYTALRQKGVEAELVRYPREGHGFSEPRHVEDARQRTLAWLGRYLSRR